MYHDPCHTPSTRVGRPPTAAASGTAAPLLTAAGYAPQVTSESACCGLTWITTGQLDGARARLLRLLEILGPYGQLSEFDNGMWQYGYLRSRGNTIEGGTTEVLKNIIAERVLGLPRLR